MLATNNKYALFLLLIILVLTKEPIKASKVLKVIIFMIIKLKKLASEID
jgi:hypothetical protein